MIKEFEIDGEDGDDPILVLTEAMEYFFDGVDVFIKFQSKKAYDFYKNEWSFLEEPSVTTNW